jgi:DNA-binding CsgD family transcriptional regulator
MTSDETRELGGLTGGIICWAATAHADVHRAERYVAESAAFCREHHLDVFQLFAAGAGTRVDVYRGKWDRAAANAEDILTQPNLTNLHGIWPAIALTLVRARRGQSTTMSMLDEVLENGEPDDLYRYGAVWGARAEVAWLAGDDEAARAEAERGLRTVRAHHDPWLCGNLLRWMHPPGSEPAIVACVAEPYALEVTGDWQAAADAWTRRGSPYDAAVAQLRGDVPAVEAALLVFRQLGARAAVDRAGQRLATLRGGRHVGRRADTHADPHHLTRREREILELIAVGNSDAAIARALFISQRTVNNHVHAILNKLGVHNRTQAATHAHKELGSRGA